MVKVYGKVNGVNVSRDVPVDRVAEHERRGWSTVEPKEAKPKESKATKK